MSHHTIIWLLILISHGTFVSQNFKWSLRTESGYYHNQHGLFDRSDNWLQQLDGTLSLEKEISAVQFMLKARLNPINYSLQTPSSSLRSLISSRLMMPLNRKLFLTGLLSAQDFQYQDRNNFLQYHIYQISQHYLYNLSNQQGLICNLDWFSRNFNQSRAYSLQIYKFDTMISFPLFIQSSFAVGTYFERFQLHYLNQTNRGWRYGPQFSFEYRRSCEFKIDYRFLIHSSDITLRFSYEQWLRFLFGRMLRHNLSLFFLLDYSIRDFTVRTQGDLQLLYSPVNQENGYYGRLEYDLPTSIPTSIYIKLGYSKNEVIFYDRTLSGFLCLLGFRIKN